MRMCYDKITKSSDAVSWHNCDGRIARQLHYVLSPPPEWNDGQPGWALFLSPPPTYLRISFCPICGEYLPEQEETDTDE